MMSINCPQCHRSLSKCMCSRTSELRADIAGISDRDNPLVNAARGREACGINHDELIENSDTVVQLREELSHVQDILTRWIMFAGDEEHGMPIEETQQYFCDHEFDSEDNCEMCGKRKE